MARRLARFTVSWELLAQAMQMPEGTVIHRVWQDPTKNNGEFEFVVEHPFLEEIEEAEVIPRIEPSITATTHKTLDRGVVVTSYEWDWGIA